MSSWKKGLFILLLTVVPVLLVLVVAEGVLRLLDYGDPPGLVLPVSGNPDLLRPNPAFTGPYFGRLPPRKLFPFRVPRDPPEEGIRIAVLGASAAMGDPEPSFSAARFLEKALRYRYPGVRFDCINLAITATNSHVLREVAGEVAVLKPDLAILYIGNNEVIGPFGPGTGRQFLKSYWLPPRWRIPLQRLRLTQLLQDLVHGPRSGERRWEGLRALTAYQFSRDDPALDKVYAAYSANLRAAVEALSESGTGVILGSVAVNRRDQPPFAGEAAREAFRGGRQLLAEGRAEAGWGLLEEAVDLDRLRLRADGEINRRIRDLAARTGLPLAEVRDSFRAGRGPVGYEAFWEHVHFTFAGNYHLGKVWYEAVLESLSGTGRLPGSRAYPGIKKMRTLLGYTPYEEWRLVREMIDRHGKPPFLSIPGNARRLEQLRERRERLAASMADPEVKAGIRATMEAGLAFAPDDWVLLRQSGDVHRIYGEWERAIRQYREVLARMPELDGTWYQLGLCHLESGDLEEAEHALAQARRRNPHSLSYLSDLALVRLNLGRPDEALPLIREGLRRRPDGFLLQSLLFEARLARGEGRLARSLEADLIGHRPETGGPEFRMARLYLKYGDRANALRLGRAALRKAPETEAYGRFVRRLKNGNGG